MRGKPEAFFRIEQANLYRLLLDSDLFETGDGSQEAVDIVTEEIRAFATARLEFLMGMRGADEAVIVRPAELPWSDEQIEALTALANKVLVTTSSPQLKLTSQPSLKKRGRKPKEQIQEPAKKPEFLEPVFEVKKEETIEEAKQTAKSFADNPERKPFPSQSMWNALNAQEANSNANRTASITKAGGQLFQELTK